MEFIIAAFTGVGSLLVGLVALRLQHLADAQTLVWPELVRHGSNRYVMDVRSVNGTAISVRAAMLFDDGTRGEMEMPLMEPGERWEFYREDADGAGAGPLPKVESGVVLIPSRTSRHRWQCRAVVATEAGPDDRRSAAFWSRQEPTVEAAATRLDVRLTGEQVSLMARSVT